MKLLEAAMRLKAKKQWTFSLDGRDVTVEALDAMGAWVALPLNHKEKLKDVRTVTLK